MSGTPTVHALVVTYNRRALLERCLAALLGQTRRPDRILVIDNASTDDTEAWMREVACVADDGLEYVRMSRNLGGAGGFAEGIARAIAEEADWTWMMDDDAEPHAEALEQLLRVAHSPERVYGSLAVCGAATAWPMTLEDEGGRQVSLAASIPDLARVGFLPFLGFMIHRSLVARIGLPDAGFFIAADDVEYSLRAGRAGASLWLAGRSRIEHPQASTYHFGPPGLRFLCRRLPPWKSYYDTRNKLLIARRYHGYRLWTQTLPGSLVRLCATLLREPRRLAQLHAFLAGTIDGLLGRTGRLHESWRIR